MNNALDSIPERFCDQVALVIGGAQGIGKAIAVRLAKEGASVVISDIDRRMMKETVQEIRNGGGKIHALACDVRPRSPSLQFGGGPARSLSAMTNSSFHSSDYRVVAQRLLEDYLPDANLSKAAWQGASHVTLEDTENPQLSHPGAKTEAAVRWSPEHLYVAFWCQYTELNLYLGEDARQKRWELWNRDVAEVFLTPFPETPHRYWEFEVAPNNLWIDLAVEKLEEIRLDVGWNSGFAHASFIDERYKLWSCEMGIPAVSLGVQQIERGMEWRINFYRCDGFGDNSQRRFLAWSPTFQLNFHVPERFGWVRMED